jgi:tetratricopeptide (TPR) repeat protein
MAPPLNSMTRPRIVWWRRIPARALGVFVLFLLYVWVRLEPAVEYQSARPIFYLSHAFFRGFLRHPAGLVEYAAAFLAQLNYYNWLAAAVFTAMCVLIFLASNWWLRRVSGAPAPLAAFGPAFLMLYLRERPNDPALVLGLGLLLAMGFAMSCVLWAGARAWLRWVVWPLCVALLYFVAGLWPATLFVALTGLYEILARQAWALGGGCCLMGLLGIFGTIWFCNVADPFVPPGQGMSLTAAAILYLYVPVASLALAALRGTVPRARTNGARATSGRQWFEGRLVKGTLAASVFLLGWGLVWFGFDPQNKALAQIDYYNSRGEYGKALAIAANLKQIGPSTRIRLWFDLYHTGRLGDDLFSFGAPARYEMLTGVGLGKDTCRAQSRTYLELGQVDEAEHLAHEALENEGETPETLRLLAEINVLKGRLRAARVFLSVLSLAPFERTWAQGCLRSLETDPTLSGNPELRQIRSRLASTDMVHYYTPTEGLLLQLLDANPTNQMAFEYLMSYYLLSREGNKFVERLGRLNNFGYAGVPRNWEEAVVLFQKLNGEAADLHGRQIRPGTLRRFEQYCQAAAPAQAQTAEGRRILARDFGHTYWYYHDFGSTQ